MFLWGVQFNGLVNRGSVQNNCQYACGISFNGFKTTLQVLNQDTISFGWDSPLTNIAKHCAYCGIEILTDKEAEDIIKKIPAQKGIELQDSLTFLLNKYLSLHRPAPKIPILKDLVKFSRINPEMNGNEVINNYKRAKRRHLKAKINIQKDIVQQYCNKLDPLISKVPKIYQPRLIKLINSPPHTLKSFVTQVNTIRFKTEKAPVELPAEFIAFSDKITAVYEKHKAQNKADDFLSRQFKEPPENLVRQLVEPLKVTLEHIRPHSKKGPNNTSNYLPVCSYCNVKRGNMDFPEWLKEHPEIQGFIKTSLLEIQKAIQTLTDPPKRLIKYIKNIIERLNIESQGKLVISLEE